MDKLNSSTVSEFVLLGLSTSWETKVFLMLAFSLIFLGIILGNLFIVFLVIADSNLHSPMYFLLANLSLNDVGFSSVTVPRMITDLLSEHNVISFQGCMTQICFIHIMGGMELVLLIVMAFDRYIAICKPLHYLNIMSPKRCVSFIALGWVVGFVHAISQLLLILELPFCGPRVVDSFFCDIPLVLKLACMDTETLGSIINADSGVLATTCFILLLVSYTYILLTVRLHSKDGASKALSTCTSHIIVVVLFFGPCIFIYLWPVSITWVDKFLAVFYTVITPVLNPAIYTLRNKDIRNSIKKLVSHHVNSRNIC
ncbi:olfactory receptor 4K3 [Heterocephalus glaber]|uniref:Olfactory receptor n=1 Tax=Heterocephalus glaber TaxID=10181 RepID=A0AAX6Q4F3_HETGA|nr:olfactory receptor 4K3 [Heterocephalus glaber]